MRLRPDVPTLADANPEHPAGLALRRRGREISEALDEIYGGIVAPALVTGAMGCARWRVGEDIYTPTRNGPPSWSTVRRRFWMNEAANPRHGPWTEEQLARMRRGLAPQRKNSYAPGGWESMELSHEPIPRRSGGTNLVPRWPQEHAAVDRYRRPGY